MIMLVCEEGFDRWLGKAIQFLGDFSIVVRAKQLLVPSVLILDKRDNNRKASQACNYVEEQSTDQKKTPAIVQQPS